MLSNEARTRLEEIKEHILAEHVYESELAELAKYKEEIIELEDIILAEWAGISEEEYYQALEDNTLLTENR